MTDGGSERAVKACGPGKMDEPGKRKEEPSGHEQTARPPRRTSAAIGIRHAPPLAPLPRSPILHATRTLLAISEEVYVENVNDGTPGVATEGSIIARGEAFDFLRRAS